MRILQNDVPYSILLYDYYRGVLTKPTALNFWDYNPFPLCKLSRLVGLLVEYEPD
jgi:hypothetical protein